MLKTLKNFGADNPHNGMSAKLLNKGTLARLVKMKLVGYADLGGRPRLYFLRCKVNNG